MLKSRKSLHLSRETLTHLTSEQLAKAPGGIWRPLDPDLTKIGLLCLEMSEAACTG